MGGWTGEISQWLLELSSQQQIVSTRMTAWGRHHVDRGLRRCCAVVLGTATLARLLDYPKPRGLEVLNQIMQPRLRCLPTMESAFKAE